MITKINAKENRLLTITNNILNIYDINDIKETKPTYTYKFIKKYTIITISEIEETGDYCISYYNNKKYNIGILYTKLNILQQKQVYNDKIIKAYMTGNMCVINTIKNIYVWTINKEYEIQKNIKIPFYNIKKNISTIPVLTQFEQTYDVTCTSMCPVIVLKDNDNYSINRYLPMTISIPEKITPHKNKLQFVKLSKTGKLLATISINGTILRLWDIVSLKLICEIRLGSFKTNVKEVIFSRDLKYVAVVFENLYIFKIQKKMDSYTNYLWGLTTGIDYFAYHNLDNRNSIVNFVEDSDLLIIQNDNIVTKIGFCKKSGGNCNIVYKHII